MQMSFLFISIGVLLFLRVPVAFSLLLPCLLYIFFDPFLTLGIALQRHLDAG